jgi:hypothetical protein
MPRYSDRNLYPGVNAHLNSFLQTEDGGWESFHTEYLVAIARTLDTLLPAHYYAISEKSLQISATEPELQIQRRTRPDVTIYQRGLPSAEQPYPQTVSSPTLTLPLLETLDDEEDTLTSVVIYQVEEGKYPGKPITRIEVLSPGNKPPGKHHLQYLAKRLQTLHSGLHLVEIDFLHEQRPALGVLPSYPDHDSDSFAYTITIGNPHAGYLAVYGVTPVQPLPVLPVPLAGAEFVSLDIGVIYQRVFESVRVYSMLVDYDTLPVHFDRYHPNDREKIKALLDQIRAS